MSKKLVVEKHCIGCGACSQIEPDVFIYEDDHAYVNPDLDVNYKEDDYSFCPVAAIKVKEFFAINKAVPGLGLKNIDSTRISLILKDIDSKIENEKNEEAKSILLKTKEEALYINKNVHLS